MAEKRKEPRLKNEGISLKVTAGNVDTITKCLDISASGVYCKVEKELPLMSRIKIILVMPETKGQTPGAPQTAKIEAEGVVVREHPVIEGGKVAHYDVAIFFDNLSQRDREILRSYIDRKGKK